MPDEIVQGGFLGTALDNSRITHMSILNQNPLPFFINGQYVSPTGRQTFENINPANGTPNFDVLEGNADDIDHAVNSARSALTGPWNSIDIDSRARLLHKVADLIDKHRDEFLAAEISDTGKPVQLSLIHI